MDANPIETAYPRQAILVTSEAETEIMGKKQDKKNIFTLSWHMPVSFNPSLYAISVGKQRFSLNLIKKSGVFCVNFMPFELQDKVLFCGRNSGMNKDKFKETGLTPKECGKIHCIYLKEALAYLECEVVQEIESGDHIIIIGKIVNSKVQKKGKRVFRAETIDKFTTTID